MCAAMPTAAELMPIPGHIDPVPVARSFAPRADGRIARIAQNTEPMSRKIISSGAPVRGVLEVIAGTAKKLGLAPGDKVAHPIFR